MSEFDSIDDALNVESSIVEVDDTPKSITKPEQKTDISKDYEYTRANLYSLIERVKKQSMESWNLLVKVVVQEHMKSLVS